MAEHLEEQNKKKTRTEKGQKKGLNEDNKRTKTEQGQNKGITMT